MARVNLDSVLFGDGRIDYLGKFLGTNKYEARGRIIAVWHFACAQARDVLTAEEINIQSDWFNHDDICFAEAMVKARLAESVDDQTFRVKGLRDRIQYMVDATARGQKSAQVRREKYGTAQPSRSPITLESVPKGARKDLESLSTIPERASKEARKHVEVLALAPAPAPALVLKKEEGEGKERACARNDPPPSFGGLLRAPYRPDANEAPKVLAVELQRVWNEHRGAMPPCKQMSYLRETTAADLLSVNFEKDSAYWTEVVQRMAKSPFLTGDNPRRWRASFEFLLKPDTHIRVMEGQYDGGSEVVQSKLDAIFAEIDWTIPGRKAE